jgi:hypothetical protein
MLIRRNNKILLVSVFIAGVFLLDACAAMNQQKNQGDAAMEAIRISVQDAYQQVTSGKAILVCSYDKETCSKMMLEGAITREEFESKLPSISKSQPIIFYCA